MAASFSSTKRIVIDDSDPRIQYSSGWIKEPGDNLDLGTHGQTFLGSQHGILESGQFQFTFTFTGNTIEVYGTNGQVPAGDVFDPQWTCFVDGDTVSSQAPSSDVQNNWSICERDSLSNDSHVLTVQVISQGHGKFWFDKLMYTPLEDTNGEILWLNYSDPTILYDSKWVFNNIMYALVDDTTMSVNFNGAAWTWVGELLGDGPALPSSFTYQIDGGTPITQGIDGRPASQTTLLLNHVFFSTSLLVSGSHTLSFTYKSTNGVPMSLAYAYVFSNATQVPSSSQIWPNQTSRPPSSSQSIPVTPASLSGQPTLKPFLSLSLTTTASPTALNPSLSFQSSSTPLSVTTAVKSPDQAGHHTPWRIIVAVLSSIFALALIFVLAYFWRGRRRRNRLSPFVLTAGVTSPESEKPDIATGPTPDAPVERDWSERPPSYYTQ